MAELHDFQPLENSVLVSIPERFLQKHLPGTKRLALPPPGGWDKNLIETIEDGTTSAYELQIETNDDAHQTLVQQGTVLALPLRLTENMVLCADPAKKKPKTCADIQDDLAVGDTVHIERHYLLNGDDYEISPGVYRLPYSALVAVIVPFEVDMGEGMPAEYGETIKPIGGYVLLSRVWADDVAPESEGSTLKCRKMGDLITETNVPPLENEGVVAWIDTPLRGTPDDLRVGQRVVFQGGQALVETIAGTEYIAVRHEYCLAVREPILAFKIGGKQYSASTEDFDKAIDFRARQADQMMPPWMLKYPDPEPHVPTLKSAGIMASAGFIPLQHPSYNA